MLKAYKFSSICGNLELIGCFCITFEASSADIHKWIRIGKLNWSRNNVSFKLSVLEWIFEDPTLLYGVRNGETRVEICQRKTRYIIRNETKLKGRNGEEDRGWTYIDRIGSGISPMTWKSKNDPPIFCSTIPVTEYHNIWFNRTIVFPQIAPILSSHFILVVRKINCVGTIHIWAIGKSITPSRR